MKKELNEFGMTSERTIELTEKLNDISKEIINKLDKDDEDYPYLIMIISKASEITNDFNEYAYVMLGILRHIHEYAMQKMLAEYMTELITENQIQNGNQFKA